MTDATVTARIVRLPLPADTVLDAARAVLARRDYFTYPASVEPPEEGVTFSTPEDSVTLRYTLTVTPARDGTVVGVLVEGTAGAAPDRAARRRAKRVAKGVLGQVREDLGGSQLDAREMEQVREELGVENQFLARLTGRRAWLAALVLAVAYLVPLLAVRGVGELVSGGALPPGGVSVAVASALGVGGVVALTVRFGGWIQLVSFGEEYPLTFSPLSGYLLGFWRFGVQLAALILVIVALTDLGEAGTEARMNDDATAAFDTYVEAVPTPGAGTRMSGTVSQSEYEEVPNAQYLARYEVPADFVLARVRAWLESERWGTGPSTGARAGERVGRLRNVDCATDGSTCEAEVTPGSGPVEYTVDVILDDAEPGEDVRELWLRLQYRQASAQ